MILKDQHIFILGAARFDGPDQSTSFNTAIQLAKNNQVFYIDYPITWKDLIGSRNSRNLNSRPEHFNFLSNGLIESGIKNLSILLVPPLLSINFLSEGKLYRTLLKINEHFIRRRIKSILKYHKIKDYIYINSFNFHYPGVADKLVPALSVYHCVDPMIIPYDMKHGIVSEAELVRKSDLVICTSRQLHEEKVIQNPNTYFIPNAADLSQSSKALDPTLPVSIHLQYLKQPIIGYAGSIERRIDFELLLEVLRQNRDKTFVFAGSISPEFVPDWFYKEPNLHLTGRLDFSDIPALLKGFAVAIIPFKRDEVSRTIFPLKLFEYLGAGKPVVATNFNPDLKEFTANTVAYVSNASEFSRALTESLISDNIDLINSRVRIAEENTWEKRVNELSKIMSTALEDKKKLNPLS